ncbi:hypothetical protein RJ55_00255 [Drechmeria coniospora]|nr:hypothetical protein RJ55_00255 [Drechmeria coniospora]
MPRAAGSGHGTCSPCVVREPFRRRFECRSRAASPSTVLRRSYPSSWSGRVARHAAREDGAPRDEGGPRPSLGNGSPGSTSLPSTRFRSSSEAGGTRCPRHGGLAHADDDDLARRRRQPSIGARRRVASFVHDWAPPGPEHDPRSVSHPYPYGTEWESEQVQRPRKGQPRSKGPSDAWTRTEAGDGAFSRRPTHQ